jgi:hypothetical protein
MSITHYVREALKEMQAGASLDRFIELRYHIMHKACPHGVFSVEQATVSFFELAYKHIRGEEPYPLPNTDGTVRLLSEYDRHYIAWIKQAQAEKA